MKAPALSDRRPPAVTERDAALRRFDLAARVALLSAGLAAQAAMWAVGHSRVYLVSAVLLIAVSVESSRRPLRTFVATAKGRRRKFSQRQLVAVRVVGGVLVAEACLGVVGWLQFADMQSMATPLGLLLVSVQVAHVTAVESRRDLKLGCAVVVALLVHAGAFTATAAVKFPMLGALVALLAAAALLQRASALAQVDAVALPGRAPVARALAAPVTTALVVGAVVFLALPNSLDLGVKAAVRPSGSHAGATAQSADAAATTAPDIRTIADAGATTLDLRTRGDLPTTPEVIVDASAPAYWQGSVFDHFDGTTWTATAGASSASAQWPVDGSGVQTAPPDPTAVTGSGVRRTDLVDVVSPSPLDVVLAPGHPVAYRGAGYVTADEHAAQLIGGPADGAVYQVTSTRIDASAAQLRAAKGADADDQRWHSLPPDLPARVPDLAAELAGHAASRYDAVTAIEDYLRTHETYDLKSALPAPGDDAVDDFLFVTNRGFCEQFATAAVVMLRSIGIPARLVVGFAGGDTTSQPGHRILRGIDAHAWVQVWYQGIGWVDSDPTASAVLASDQTAPAKTAGVPPVAPSAAATAQPTSQPSAQPSTQPTAQPSTQPTAHPSSALPKPTKTVIPGGRAVWLEAIGALTILGILLSWLGRQLLRRRRRKPTHSWRPTDGPVLQAYLRLDSSLAGASRSRAPQESLRDVGRRLADAGAFVDRHGRRAASVDEIATTLHCLEQECYGIEPPTHSEVVAAVDVLDRLRRGAGSLPVTPDLAALSVNSTR